jgi:transposase
VPRRKTDVKDSDRICQLVQHGLVRPSFVPPAEIRRLRDLTRLRKAQINERARAIQRLEEVLQDAGIKLSSVASTSYSKSARAMLEALLGGITDPEQLAELAKARMRQKIPQLREALASRFQIEYHGVMVAQLLAHIDALDAAIANLNDRIAAVLDPRQDLDRAAVHDPRRPHPCRPGPDRRMRPGHDGAFRPSSTSPHGPEPARDITSRPAAAAPDAPVPGRAG